MWNEQLAYEKKYQSKSKLCEKVKDIVGNPLNMWVVAASLESLGIREKDVPEYGYDSIFELSDAIYFEIKEELNSEWNFRKRPWEDRLLRPSVMDHLKLFAKYYSQGLLFSIPILTQVAAIFMFRYSLWAWLDFNEAQATMVAMGTIIAFIITGGFIQVMGRTVASGIEERKYQTASKYAVNIIKWGTITSLLVALTFYLLNIIILFYPQRMVVMGLIYMLLIAQVLLASSILYALKRHVALVGIIVFGTAAVIINMDVINLGIYLSHWLGLVITICSLYCYGIYRLYSLLKKGKAIETKPQIPDPEVLFYLNYRYFVYGVAYFFFLFIDRFLAWSTGESSPAYLVWFNTPYELGMDWALLTLILSIAVLEYSIHAFSSHLELLQKRAKFKQLKAFKSYYKSFYFKQIALVLGIGIFSVFLTYYSVNFLTVFQNDIPELRDFFANSVTEKVFWIASISYLFLNIGLLHSLFFITLNKASFALNSLLAGLLTNVIVGFLCSRIFSFEYATIGLLVGSIVFALVSGYKAHGFFDDLDYYYYSAY